MVVPQEEVVEAEEDLRIISHGCGCKEDFHNIPPAPPGIGGGGGGGGGGGAGMLPDVYMLSGVFRCARVSQSNKRYVAD
jgi:hypothetical protein